MPQARALTVLAGLVGLCLLAPTPARVAATEKLVFEDTFALTPRRLLDGDVRPYPDPATWAFTFWPGTRFPGSYGDGTNWLAGNGESQVYTSRLLTRIQGHAIPPAERYDPFTVQADGLHIKAAELSAEQQALYHVGGHRRFASGMLLSRRSFRGGRIRMLAKLPSARGAWPALWLLPEDHAWPPEIDAFEAFPWGEHRKQLHVGAIPSALDGPQPKQDWLPIPTEPASGFHEYGLDWTDQTLTYFYDGQVIHRQPTPPSLRNRAMYLIVNFAVGGKWPYNELGIQPIDGMSEERLQAGANLIEKDYPAEMIVRSVRIWQPG